MTTPAAIQPAWVIFMYKYRVAQQKWYQLTFLLVTFECPVVIRLFLAYVNCIKQQMV